MAIHLPPDKVIPNVVSILIDLSVAAIDSLTGKKNNLVRDTPMRVTHCLCLQIKLVEPNITSESPSHRRASFLSLAVVVEGCADYIKNRSDPRSRF